MDRVPETPSPPSGPGLKDLQAYAGSFNWLATRTRTDLSYATSLLASTACYHSEWSNDLAKKALRDLAGTIEQGLLMTREGDDNDLVVYSDAGFAGADTKSQSGLVILWGGSIITWRSSKASLSALSTAEAELCAAALGWQVTEGLRYLLMTLNLHASAIRVMIDNKAALTAATLGASWRTRYYAVRAARLLEESAQEQVIISHCPTKLMVADGLTKLATAEVLEDLRRVMNGQHRTAALSDTQSRTAAAYQSRRDWSPPQRRAHGRDGPAGTGIPRVASHILYEDYPTHHLARFKDCSPP